MSHRFCCPIILLSVFLACSDHRVDERPNSTSRPEHPFQATESIPTRTEWLHRIQSTDDRNIDLDEAATVLGNRATGGRAQALPSVKASLLPHLRKAASQLPPGATDEDKIRALNEFVLPPMRRALSGELKWLHDAFGGMGGDCVPLSLGYLVAGEQVGLRLSIIILPHHVFLFQDRGTSRRYIETTAVGADLSVAQYRQALAVIAVSEAVPEDPDALAKYLAPRTRREFVSLLLCQGESKSKEQSLEDFQDAARLCPDFYVPMKHLGGYYGTKGGDFEKAEEWLTKSIEAAPYIPSLYWNRSGIRGLRKQFRLAEEDLDRAITLAPHHSHYRFEKALGLHELGRTFEAIESCSKAIEYSPRVAEYWKTRGVFLGLVKKHKEAAEDFTHAIELEPRNGALYRARATAWAMLGDEVKYTEDMKKAKELKPDR